MTESNKLLFYKSFTIHKDNRGYNATFNINIPDVKKPYKYRYWQRSSDKFESEEQFIEHVIEAFEKGMCKSASGKILRLHEGYLAWTIDESKNTEMLLTLKKRKELIEVKNEIGQIYSSVFSISNDLWNLKNLCDKYIFDLGSSKTEVTHA